MVELRNGFESLCLVVIYIFFVYFFRIKEYGLSMIKIDDNRIGRCIFFKGNDSEYFEKCNFL